MGVNMLYKGRLSERYFNEPQNIIEYVESVECEHIPFNEISREFFDKEPMEVDEFVDSNIESIINDHIKKSPVMNCCNAGICHKNYVSK